MKTFLLILAAMAVSSATFGQSPACNSTPLNATNADPIKGVGCVESGVEGGCLMVTDRSSGKTYNVFFLNGTAPAIHTAIRFQGKIHNGPTTCMENTPLDVSSCVVLRLHCPLRTTSGAAAAPAVAGDGEVDCKDWKATLSTKSKTLRVSASCTVQNGTKLSLAPHVPQGFVPTTRILDLQVEPPSTPAKSKLMVPFQLVYTEEAEQNYTKFQIGPTGKEKPVTKIP